LESIFQDGGPLRVPSNSNSSFQIDNPFSWTTRFPVLYLESSYQSGFSYWNSSEGAGEVELMTDPAAVVYEGISEFLSRYAQYQQRPVFLAGQFLGAYFLPQVAERLIKVGVPLRNGSIEVNVTGVGIGSPMASVGVMLRASADFALNLAIIDRRQMQTVTSVIDDALVLMQNGSWDSAGDSIRAVYALLSNYTGNINPHDARVFEPYDMKALETYVTLPGVRQALGVGDRALNMCKSELDPLNLLFLNRSSTAMEALSSLAKITRVLLYSGQWDLTVPPSALDQIVDMPQGVKRGVWIGDSDEDSNVRGLVKISQNITTALLVESGRRTGADVGKALLELLTNFINNNASAFRFAQNLTASTDRTLKTTQHHSDRAAALHMRHHPHAPHPPFDRPPNANFITQEPKMRACAQDAPLLSPVQAQARRVRHGAGETGQDGNRLRPHHDPGGKWAGTRIEEGGNKPYQETCVRGLPMGEMNRGNESTCTGHAGYLESPSAGKANLQASNLFYWFFESQDGNSSAPIILWLQGGPACSSMYGLFYELGPLQFDSDGNVQRMPHTHTWNSHFALMFLDSPAPTGFSYFSLVNNAGLRDSNVVNNTNFPMDAQSEGPYARTSEAVAESIYWSVVQFFSKFPNFASRQLYIAGESYAGKFIPILAYRIIQGNVKGEAPRTVNIAGIILGNVWVDPVHQSPGYAEYAYQMGLTDRWQRDELLQTEHQILALLSKSEFEEAFTLSDGQFNAANEYGGTPVYYDLREYSSSEDDHLEEYLNRQDVQTSINVGTKNYSDCDDAAYYALDGDEMRDASYALAPILNAGVNVLIFNV